MRKLRVVLLVSVSCSVPMLGQTDKGELFGGYSFERIAPGCGSNYRCGGGDAGPATNLNGWTASLTGYFYRSLGISAQFTGNYNGTAALSYSTVHRYTYQFGPAYAFRWQRASAFAHWARSSRWRNRLVAAARTRLAPAAAQISLELTTYRQNIDWQHVCINLCDANVYLRLVSHCSRLDWGRAKGRRRKQIRSRARKIQLRGGCNEP